MKKQNEPRKCDICGEMFVPSRSTQHYCRREITRKCLICGNEFITNCSPDGKLVCSKPECRKFANQVSNPVERECKCCGKKFTTIFYKQMYCKQEKEKVCPICRNIFKYKCESFVPETCGNTRCQGQLIKKKRVESTSKQFRICKYCGKEFNPKEPRDIYCYETHFKTCVICGKQFEVDPRNGTDKTETCSKECMGKLMSQNHDYVKGAETLKKVMQEKYGVDNPAQLSETQEKIRTTCLEKYGSEWYTKTEEYKEKAKATNLEKYGSEWYLGSEESLKRRTETNMQKYGVPNVFQADEIKEKSRKTMLDKYGQEHAMNVLEFRKKAIGGARFSKLEERICNLLDNYKIEYIHQYYLSKGKWGHLFDFYLPEYKLLIDADGLYYHSYLDDPDGERVRDDYDEIRLMMIPEDHRFYLIVEGQEDDQVKDLVRMLEEIKGSLSSFDSVVLDWCKSIEFPYPEYTDKRMRSDYTHLIRHESKEGEYVPQCRLGQSILKNFHRSIYHARVKDSVSPYEGWKDEDKLKQVIRNRFMYVNNVDPSKVLTGFSVSKICPCVSTFNPVLAKYLVDVYLKEFSSVFDPFSGFSGRLIGVASTGKGYQGQDLNEEAVGEANKIIDFLDLDRDKYSIIQKDILDSSGEHECLLTCPPYYKKEIYNTETVFKSCDDWIAECLERFKCKRYVFVIDETEKFKDNVVETLKSHSHLSKATEYIVVIDKDGR